MSDRAFIDTNVFVCADDADQPARRAVARRVITELATARGGVVSTQVLIEYVAAARRKLGLTLAQCRQALVPMCGFDVVVIRPDLVLAALDLAATYQLSHWDGLIVKAASASRCQRLITGDLQHGQVIDGVRIENPFA